MSSWDSEFASTPSFHPEFGVLCPSQRFLHRLRQTAVAIVLAVIVIGGTALALAPQLSPHRDIVREEGMRGGIELLPDNSASAVQPDTSKAPAGSSAMAFVSRARAQAQCDDLSDSFLSPQCQLGKSGKAHLARTAHQQGAQVSTVVLGRTETHPQNSPQPARAPEPASAPQPASAPAREAAIAPPAAEAAAAVDLPLERPPLPPKRPEKQDKPVKVVRSKPLPLHDMASVEEQQPAPAPSVDLFGLFRGFSGNGSGAWVMQR
jgi:hypothetical protein